MKKIVFVMLLALCGSAAVAQEGLNRRVEVTKAYAPEVGRADKLGVRPRMEDTVALRPEISYSIRPLAWQTAFGVKPIAAAMVDARLDGREPLAYVRLGAGFPLQSVADAYVHTESYRGIAGGYINHYGSWSDIDNDLGAATDAAWSTNRFGAYGALRASERFTLRGEVTYDWNYYTRYGLAVPADYSGMAPDEAATQRYSAPRASVWFGDRFTDLGYLNFRVGVAGGYFSDDDSNSETDFSLRADVGQMFGRHRLALGARFDGWRGGGSLKGYRNHVLMLSPCYGADLRKVRISAGFDVVMDDNTEDTDLWVFPQVKVNWDPARGYFVPFVEVGGGLVQNGYRNLACRNPYVLPGASVHNTARYDLHGGISGSVSSEFAYRAYAGASFYRSHLLFVYDYSNPGGFLPGSQDVAQLTVGGEVSGRIPGGFEALLNARLHFYPDNTGSQKAADMPNMEIGLSVRYTWHDRLVLTAGLDVTGTRYAYAGLNGTGEPYLDTELAPVADLRLGADYRFGKRLGVFIEGRNLLGADLYPYNHYRGLGVSVLGGIKLTF